MAFERHRSSLAPLVWQSCAFELSSSNVVTLDPPNPPRGRIIGIRDLKLQGHAC